MPNDDRLPTAAVGTKVGHDLALTETGVVMPDRLGDMVEFAQIMCKADVAIPKHLRGNPGSCLAVAMRARAWRMDPFAVATKTYSVNDILAYESQLITAVINRHAPVKGRLVPRYTGQGGERQCFIEATTHDGQVLPYESPKVKDIGVKNSPLWKNDPDQQLFYSSARAWARRYFPELLLGVYDLDEARAMRDVTPPEERKVVDNFLHDEAEPRQVEEASDLIANVNMAPGSVNEVPHNPETGEILEPRTMRVTEYNPKTGEMETRFEPEVVELPQPIPPDVIARNLLKAAAGFSSLAMLDAWAEESKADIAGLPAAERKKVEKAIVAARMGLSEL